MKVLIIEDEPFAQQELKRLLHELDTNIEILEMIDSVEEAIAWLDQNHHPELIFLDIQLADGLSFEIFKAVQVHSPVIFTTAYDQYAIEAFQLNSIDYLLKPIKKAHLRKALDKLHLIRKQFGTKELGALNLSQKQLESVISLLPKEYKSRFITRIGDQIKHIGIEEIAYFYAEDNVVFLVTRANERFIIDYPIEEISKMINPKDFYRLNRAFVSHIDAIHKIHKYLNSRLKIELTPPCDKLVLVSRVKVVAFLNWMDK